MYYLKRSMTTETAHSLHGHNGLCQYIHGHSYKWTVTISTRSLINGMVMDFGLLKEIMNKVIGRFDHAIIVQVTSMEEGEAEREYENSRMILVPYRPTAENLAKAVFDAFCVFGLLPDHISLVSVECRETENNSAVYQRTPAY